MKFQSDLAIHLVWGDVWRLLAGLFSRDRPLAGTPFDNFKPSSHILLDRLIIAEAQEKQFTRLMAPSSTGSRGAPPHSVWPPRENLSASATRAD